MVIACYKGGGSWEGEEFAQVGQGREKKGAGGNFFRGELWVCGVGRDSPLVCPFENLVKFGGLWLSYLKI